MRARRGCVPGGHCLYMPPYLGFSVRTLLAFHKRESGFFPVKNLPVITWLRVVATSPRTIRGWSARPAPWRFPAPFGVTRVGEHRGECVADRRRGRFGDPSRACLGDAPRVDVLVLGEQRDHHLRHPGGQGAERRAATAVAHDGRGPRRPRPRRARSPGPPTARPGRAAVRGPNDAGSVPWPTVTSTSVSRSATAASASPYTPANRGCVPATLPNVTYTNGLRGPGTGHAGSR